MADSNSVDNDLLARLNALKKSSVSFGARVPSSESRDESPRPVDDLAARFARLGSASPSPAPQPHPSVTPVLAPGAPSYLEGIAQGVGGSDVQFNEDDEKSLEELLAELNGAVGERKDWDVSRKEQEDVGKLLKDMKKILPEVVNSRRQDIETGNVRDTSISKEGLTDWESVEINVGTGGVDLAREAAEEESGDDQKNRNQAEENEADEIIAKVMAELEISRKYDQPSPSDEEKSEPGIQPVRGQNNNQSHDTGFALPSAPTELPEDDLARTQAIEDALTARMAALAAPQTDSLGLPSAPSFSPRKKPAVASNLQQRLDDEIDSWCIICQDDATLRCTGCDGDLYCQNCWMEGHRGESAGFEERGHKAILYTKKKKQAAA